MLLLGPHFLLFTIFSVASFKANKNNGQRLFRTLPCAKHELEH